MNEHYPMFGAEVHTEQLHDLVGDFGIEYKVNPAGQPPSDLIHYHECFELVLYAQSDNKAFVEDQMLELKTHEMLIVAPWQIHKINYRQDQVYSRYVLYFTSKHVTSAFPHDQAQEMLRFLTRQPGQQVSLTLSEFSRLNNLFKNFAYHMTQFGANQMGILEAYSSVALHEIHQILSKQAHQDITERKRSIVEQCLQYINQHYQEGISLDDLEKELFLNKCYISRAFAETMGTSPVQYLHFKRIIEAQRMLTDTDMSIIDIGFACGFNNLQHFYRIFKKVTTMTPKHFRSGDKPAGYKSAKVARTLPASMPVDTSGEQPL